MPKNRIGKEIYERCLLTEVAPYETPIRFSNWGSFNYMRKADELAVDPILKRIFEKQRYSIPFNFRIKKDLVGTRTLQLVHPNCSLSVTDLYAKFDTYIARSCSKSNFSIRAPHAISTYFVTERTKEEYSKILEHMTEADAYAASYFNYQNFSHLHKFFDSPEFLSLEKKYSNMAHIDISKFFPSIYTHTISWAIRGKTETKNLLAVRKKDKSFTAVFDKLMQYMNYNETNGIPVGPELSRIFAEIIMQRIDTSIEKAMMSLGYEHANVYQCCRYIDDFFLFFNDDNLKEKFYAIVKDELEHYRLHINQKKSRETKRPFITEVSKRKIEISSCVTKLTNSIRNNHRNLEKNAIERLRVIASDIGDDYYALTNVFLSAIYRQCKSLPHHITKENDLARGLVVYLGVAFHWFMLDMRVNGSYKIGKLISLVLEICSGFSGPYRIQVTNKIYTEIIEAIKQATLQERIIEALNLAIVANDFGKDYPIPFDVLEALSKKSKKVFGEDETDLPRMSYFSIITLLYCCAGSPELRPIFDDALSEARELIKRFDPRFYAETAYLLLDLLTCPYIQETEKVDLAKNFLAYSSTVLGKKKILESIKVIESHSWYFDWSPKNNTKKLLKKKEYLLSY